ncbi:MAG TPA: copper homeostasis protein CutC [Micromonosporaceae bacterium]|nr:copper homeostasis protein CutC [Micromonosporaceae bacterium]
MSSPILEVISLDATDARNAQAGGADRIELVSDMLRGGLTPSVETFVSVRAATDLPIRVMIRQQDGYAAGAVGVLRHAAKELRANGADEFVLGFLDDRGAVDVKSVAALLEVIDGCSWTFHRALDHATDRAAAWQAIEDLPGLDFVLTSGGPLGVGEGIDTLIAEAGLRSEPRILAGGVLREQHLSALLEGGVDAFHTGSAVRVDGRWDAPVDVIAVSRWTLAVSRGQDRASEHGPSAFRNDAGPAV